MRLECAVESKLGKKVSIANSDDEDSEEDSEDESSDEEEDEDGELVTEEVDAQINATLNAIRNKDPRVYDKNARFFPEVKEEDFQEEEGEKPKKEKPMYLRDYHRENLLKGGAFAEEEEEQKQAPKTYVQEQEELKRTVVQEMHAAAEDGDSDNDDDFLVRKSKPEDEEPRREIELDVENADKDPEKFLQDYMAARAWIPTENSKFQPLESDDDEEDEQADMFEEAYNFRFEDPNKVNERIITHSRDTTNQFSVRRKEMNARKRKREAEKLKKEEEKRAREMERNRLRKLKMEELEEKVRKIKQAAGMKSVNITEKEWAELLDKDFDDETWEKEMQKRFGDEYYAEEDAEMEGEEDDDESSGKKKKRRPKKPTWDDDIDIKDIVPDYEDEDTAPSDDEGDGEDGDEEPAEGEEEDKDEGDGKKKKKKKSRAQEKREQKRAAKFERRIIEEAVDRNLDLDLQLLPGATKKNAGHFRYRETSPESFGLTPRDILMASDAQLNQYVGLKKLATFRDPEKKRRDRKRLGKKARLRAWRKEVFGDENGPKWEFPSASDAAQTGPAGENDEVAVDVREGPRKKKRKRSKKKKN